MKLKFWQKTYLLTLVVFLLCLDLSVFALAYYSYRHNLNEAADSASSLESYISRSFERDLSDMMMFNGTAKPERLMESYGSVYQKQGVFLEFRKEGQVVYSTFPIKHSLSGESAKSYEILDGRRFLLLSSPVGNTGFILVFGKDLTGLYTEFGQMVVTYVLTALGVSVFTGILLYLVLRRLTVPLERLRKATEEISMGDSGARADESRTDEFGELGKSFNIMVDRIESNLNELRSTAEQKQRLVDDLAHELRTPLTSIYGYAEYLRRSKTDEDEKIECAIAIMRESRRLQNISEKLLDTAFIRENAIKRVPVNLKTIVESVAESLKSKAENAGISLETESRAITVQGDETLLNMLLYNLTENALKACEPGGNVVIGSGAVDGIAFLSVKDDGKGMTVDQVARITEPFYRTDKSRSRAEGGAGLGLALCSQIANAHSAKMIFDSAPGRGTEVNVKFSDN